MSQSAIKVCNACRLPKPVAEFYSHSLSKDGYGWTCKPCLAARRKVLREKDPEKAREANRRSHEAHRDKRNADSRAYYRLNRDRILAELREERPGARRRAPAGCARPVPG